MIMYKSPLSGVSYSLYVELELTVLPDDRLHIGLTHDSEPLHLDLVLQAIKAHPTRTAVDFYLEALERYRANGWGNVRPEHIGALTSDPFMLTDDFTIDDNGEVIVGRVWHFPDYMIACPLERILRDGKVIFPLAPDAPQPTTKPNQE